MSAGITVEPSSQHSRDIRQPRRHRTKRITAGSRRFPGQIDLEAIQQAVRTILEAVGEDPDRPGLIDTPRRVARMYAEMFSGLQTDPARHLHVTFPEEFANQHTVAQET